jgi:hypothetical protein
VNRHTIDCFKAVFSLLASAAAAERQKGQKQCCVVFSAVYLYRVFQNERNISNQSDVKAK